MSDSFADLWNSTAPTKPSQPPQPRILGSIQPSAQQRKPQHDVFSMLAAASPASSRSVTPSYVPSPAVPRPAPLRNTASIGGAKPVQKANSGGGDAFSDLFSGTSSSSSNHANLTIAERAALAEKQRQPQQTRSQKSDQHSGSAWAGLDALGTSTFGSSRTSSVSPIPPQDDDWKDILESDPPAPVPVAKKLSTQDDDDWGLGDFVSNPNVKQPVPAQAKSKSQTQSLWSMDEFTTGSSPASVRASPASDKGRSSTPGSFDFGEREDGLLDDLSGDEDDILGVLGKPAQPRPSSSNAQVKPPSPPSPKPPSAPRSRAVSPPPHIVGQIVEMGFTPQQARVALAATDTGLDVQAALETLLANGAGGSSRHSSPPVEARVRDQRRRRGPGDSDSDDAPPPHPRIPPRRDRQREPPRRDHPDTTSDAQKNLQDQANELLAQASTIGLSMFNRANALWKEGKEKVQKAYEERSAVAAGSTISRTASKDGRPKWMQDAPEEIQGGWGEDRRTASTFKDEHNDDDDALPRRPRDQPSRQRSIGAKPPVQPVPPDAATSRSKTVDLFGEEAPKVYVSPFRRKAPPRSQAPPFVDSQPSAPPSAAPAPPPLLQRKCVLASPSEIATSAKHKASGTEMFKLGRYAEAETAYSYSIAALPDNHLLLVPLHNNRALTRIKTGDHGGAIEDCTTALKIIGLGYHPAREAKITKEDEGAGVDLADAYVKALRRRAEAHEGKEKWEAAKLDWEAIIAIEWAAKARTDAIQAASRCRRMLTIDSNGSAPASAPASAPKLQPKPKPKPAPARPTPPSEALNRVREANQAAEAEDQEKHALKDQVDARLLAWKGGKEANIRALIASLDTVLWPELGLQKVGMHELISPSQVKIRYTKTIAKLHPDKLNTRNTSLEQRMIANGVFGALNEAWNAFKP